MDELISRQAAIDAAVQSIVKWDGMHRQDANCRIRDAINELPSAQQWVSVKDRLPDTCRMVLVCNDDRKIAVAQYVGDDGYWPWKIAYCPYDVDVWDDSENGPVMAWMELPKPWKEGVDE